MTTPTPASQPQTAVAATTPFRHRAHAGNASAPSTASPGSSAAHPGRSGIWSPVCSRGATPASTGWLVHELGTVVPTPATVLELGCGPGIALRELLTAYPAASVIGVDRSPVVLKSARRRNASAIAEGRLTLVTGDIEKTVGYAPADLVLASHVLYFWADPVRELRRINEVLAPHGHVALGYQLRQHMPPITQRTFPQEGFTLYDSDDQVAAALQHAGFTPPRSASSGTRPIPAGGWHWPRPRRAPGRCEKSAHRQNTHA